MRFLLFTLSLFRRGLFVSYSREAQGERKRKRSCSHCPPHAFYFSIIAIFIGILSGSLCGGESYLLQSLKVLYLKCDSKLKDPHALQFMNLNSK